METHPDSLKHTGVFNGPGCYHCTNNFTLFIITSYHKVPTFKAKRWENTLPEGFAKFTRKRIMHGTFPIKFQRVEEKVR